MQPDWIGEFARLGPWIVAVVAILAWGFRSGRSSHGERDDEARRQTALLERIAANVERPRQN